MSRIAASLQQEASATHVACTRQGLANTRPHADTDSDKDAQTQTHAHHPTLPLVRRALVRRASARDDDRHRQAAPLPPPTTPPLSLCLCLSGPLSPSLPPSLSLSLSLPPPSDALTASKSHCSTYQHTPCGKVHRPHPRLAHVQGACYHSQLSSWSYPLSTAAFPSSLSQRPADPKIRVMCCRRGAFAMRPRRRLLHAARAEGAMNVPTPRRMRCGK